MTPSKQWVQNHLADAPSELLEFISRALPPRDPGPVPETLAELALALYAQVAESSGGRDDALPLLAADALLTHAFEAQAEIAPSGIAAFAEQWGARGRLGEVVV